MTLEIELPQGVTRTHNDIPPTVQLLADNYENYLALVQRLPETYSFSTGQRYVGPGTSNIYITICDHSQLKF